MFFHSFHSCMLLCDGLLSKLLGGNRTDNRNVVLVLAVSLIHEEKPEQEEGQRNHQADGGQDYRSPSADADHDSHHDAPRDAEHKSRHAEQNGLHGMKAHEVITLVRLKYEKYDPADQAENVREGAGDIRREAGTAPRQASRDNLRARSRGLSRSCDLTPATSAKSRSFLQCRTTSCTE